MISVTIKDVRRIGNSVALSYIINDDSTNPISHVNREIFVTSADAPVVDDLKLAVLSDLRNYEGERNTNNFLKQYIGQTFTKTQLGG